MGVFASWGPKKFLISPDKIVTLDGLSTSVALKTDSENDTSGTSPSNTKGRELQPISFSVTYFRGVGVDPRAQWEEWESLVGSAYPLYIGGKLFGPKQMILKGADLSEVQMNNNGVFVFVKISVSLEEKPTTQKTTRTVSTGTTSAKKKALIPTATTDEKQAKKLIDKGALR